VDVVSSVPVYNNNFVKYGVVNIKLVQDARRTALQAYTAYTHTLHAKDTMGLKTKLEPSIAPPSQWAYNVTTYAVTLALEL
jgi:hypothetical protein